MADVTIDELEDLQEALGRALGYGGSSSQLVTLKLTKMQLATLLAMVNLELRDAS